ncbi:MAG: ThuA domain-containing protein [Chloroflexi bacterium]|nr:ThuA domain-containing protein [Chloroflexota bacterium]
MAQTWTGAARVALVTATAGYYHESIPTAQRILHEIAQRDGHLDIGTVISDSDGLSRLTPALLAEHDLLCFVSTSGELPLTDEQKRAILEFVASGKGFVGVHGATTTLKAWPDYAELLGAVFAMHPKALSFGVIVEDQSHPATHHLPPTFSVMDELYTFTDNPRERVHVLLRAASGSADLIGDLPLAWTKTYGEGRVYYNALGHFDAGWERADFQAQIRGGLRWAARLEP